MKKNIYDVEYMNGDVKGILYAWVAYSEDECYEKCGKILSEAIYGTLNAGEVIDYPDIKIINVMKSKYTEKDLHPSVLEEN